MIKISAAVNSEARRKSRGKNRAEPGFLFFPFLPDFRESHPHSAEIQSFQKKSGYMVEITGKSVILYIEPL